MRRCILFPCPGCERVRTADDGHHLCRECEGYSEIDTRGVTQPPPDSAVSGRERQ